jgi:outer membrane protein TolC
MMFKNILMVGGMFFAALIFLCFNTAYAESLADLQERAVQNRELIEKYRNNIIKGELDVRVSKSALMPSADVSYVANRLDKDGLTENRENSALAWILSYNIFAGFRDKYNIRAAEQIKKSQEYELEKTVQDIKYRVAGRYVEIYGKKGSQAVSQDECNLLQKRYEDAENRYNVGLIRKNDLLKIKVEMDDAEQRLKKAGAETMKSVNGLAFEIDSPVDPKALNFSEFNTVSQIRDEEYYRSRMFEKRSDIKALEMVIQANENRVLVAKSAYYPSVDIQGSYKPAGNDYALGTMNNEKGEELRLQLLVRMNLFDGFKKDNTIRKADVEVINARYDMDELKKSLNTDLKNTLLDYDVAVKNMKVAEASIVQAEENLRITDASYKEGVDTTTGVLDAIFYLSRAKNNFINARNEVFANYYKLTRLTDDF